MNKKGQFTIVTLIAAFLGLVLFGALLQPMLDVISTATSIEGIDSWSVTILNLYPFIILLSMLAGVIYYVMPQRRV